MAMAVKTSYNSNTNYSSSSSSNKENNGFTLLQEDSLDDRPCAAVKNFVASVLDKKDLKDQDVAASFRSVSLLSHFILVTLVSASFDLYNKDSMDTASLGMIAMWIVRVVCFC